MHRLIDARARIRRCIRPLTDWQRVRCSFGFDERCVTATQEQQGKHMSRGCV
jgi:hypothetical protein